MSSLLIYSHFHVYMYTNNDDIAMCQESTITNESVVTDKKYSADYTKLGATSRKVTTDGRPMIRPPTYGRHNVGRHG